MTGAAAESACQYGMSPILWPYWDPRPWCHWDPGLDLFVANGQCGDALVSPLEPGPTCIDGSTP